jgi:hypothetical protein
VDITEDGYIRPKHIVEPCVEKGTSLNVIGCVEVTVIDKNSIQHTGMTDHRLELLYCNK